MSWRIEAIGRPEIAAGLGLAGLRAREAPTVTEAAERLRELGREPEVGVILLEDTLYEHLPQELHRALGRRALPMVVPFPGPRWEARPESAEAYVIELLRQVVGYRVRLK